jgi:hypothetical protein
VVLWREVPPQQSDGGQRHRARDEVVEDHGKTSAGSSRLDPVAGGVLGEEEHLRAVAEERPVALASVERGPCLERGQMGDELDRSLSLLAGEHADAGEEILIRKSGRDSEHVRIHALCLSRPISRPRGGSGLAPERRFTVSSAPSNPAVREALGEA